MKIAFVYDLPYPWSIGGIELIKKLEADELAKNNDVHFFTMQWKGMKTAFKKKGVVYHAWYPVSTDTLYRHDRRSIRKAVAFGFGLFRLFRYRFDIVVIDQFPYLHIPLVLLYSKLTGCKLVMDVAEVWTKDYWNSYLGVFGGLAYRCTKVFVRGADFYIVNSSKTGNELRKFGINKSRIRIFAPVIVENEIKKIKSTNKKKLRIIFAGRFIKEKRLDKWINIVEEISRHIGVKGIIIGTGPEKDNITKLIKKKRLEKVICVKPFFKDKTRLYRYISESSIFLNMSEREGLSIITIESLLLGTEVVLPDYSPIPKEIKSKCNVYKEEEIQKKIIDMLKYKRVKRISNTELLRNYSTSNINSFFSELYKKIDRKK